MKEVRRRRRAVVQHDRFRAPVACRRRVSDGVPVLRYFIARRSHLGIACSSCAVPDGSAFRTRSREIFLVRGLREPGMARSTCSLVFELSGGGWREQ